MLKTMTLLALVMLTSAAPTVEDKHSRELTWYKPSRTCRKADQEVKPKFKGSLEAYICDDKIKASVTGRETEAGKVTWTVDIEHIDASICPTDNLNWHIHEKRLPEDGESPGDCGATGGHSDDAFACGGASNWRTTTCNAFSDAYVKSYSVDVTEDGKEYKARCAGDVVPGGGAINAKYINTGFGFDKTGAAVPVGQAGCEFGDLGGKMGKILKQDGKQVFKDTHIQPLSVYKYASVVFHCGAPRVACADFDYDR
jgi:hypothetical protein